VAVAQGPRSDRDRWQDDAEEDCGQSAVEVWDVNEKGEGKAAKEGYHVTTRGVNVPSYPNNFAAVPKLVCEQMNKLRKALVTRSRLSTKISLSKLIRETVVQKMRCNSASSLLSALMLTTTLFASHRESLRAKVRLADVPKDSNTRDQRARRHNHE
jgi:hypothetical protein